MIKFFQRARIFYRKEKKARISQKDLDYALKVFNEIAITCSRAPDCFFKKIQKAMNAR